MIKRCVFFTIVVIALVIFIIGIIFNLNPKYFKTKLTPYLQPVINIDESYKNKITVEVTPVYELMQIAFSLTQTYQNDENLVNKKTVYYNDIHDHFSKYKTHKLIRKIENYIRDGKAYGNSSLVNRTLALGYEIDDNNNLISNNLFSVNRILFILYRADFFILSENTDLIEDFAKKSNFIEFYKKHKDYYLSQIRNYNRLCNFENMKNWLECKTDKKYQSFRIIFSPLTGGFHNTNRLLDKRNGIEQTIMFVCAPDEGIDSLSKMDFEIESGLMARVVFTEIDHNYVNPITEKYSTQLNNMLSDYTVWNSNGKSYNSPYLTFNEYMTWGVFSLYAIDNYQKEIADTVIRKMVHQMVYGRNFTEFAEFNKELIDIYSEKSKPKIEQLYLPIFEWIQKKSAPK